MSQGMVGLLTVHAAASSTDSQLVMATWGLVLATALLFLSSIVPAIGQFRDWSGKKKAIASTVIPVLHATRSHMEEVRDELLSINYTEQDKIETTYGIMRAIIDQTSELEDLPNLSLDQRLELFVLQNHLRSVSIHLSFTIGEDPELKSSLTPEEQFRRAVVQVQASFLSLDRLDRFFARFRRKTFTDEMTSRGDKDNDVAEKQLVDIRRRRLEEFRK
jgi:hypothetical protein